jgi:hypothetical protein
VIKPTTANYNVFTTSAYAHFGTISISKNGRNTDLGKGTREPKVKKYGIHPKPPSKRMKSFPVWYIPF